MPIAIPPGVFDILPSDRKDPWCSSELWQYVESVIRDTARSFGYKEIRTPIIERTELFLRGVGETTDIVSKEMYTLEDKGGRSLSLRPEGTAPVMRSFIENNLINNSSVHKLFYIGPMFRYERAQAGRYRQHHQFGAEAIGNGSPEQDVELIDLIYTVYQRLGLKNLQVYLNCIGSKETRQTYRNALQEYLSTYFNELSKDSQTRYQTNPLRILDSKDPRDKEIVAKAPSILDFLDEPTKKHFDEVQSLLTDLQIPFTINPLLVRGLDYYTKTVFEITAGELGAQNSVAGGGRYDGLMKDLDGPDLPTMGFGAGIERIIQTMLKQGVDLPESSKPVIFFIPLGDKAKKICFSILHGLRQLNIPSEMELGGKKLGKAMQYANQLGAQYVVVVGDNEINTGEVELKDMATGAINKAPLDHLGRILKLDIQSNKLLAMVAEMEKPFEEPGEMQYFIQKLGQSIEETKKISGNLQNAMEQLKEFLE